MTAQPVEQLDTSALDPTSPAGVAAADAISDFAADVISRLRRDGQSVPEAPQHSP